jgi:antiviral helicase SKI2
MMATSLLEAIEGLQISESSSIEAEPIDTYLEEHRPRKRAASTLEELQKELEEEFLRPSTTFSSSWLNKLQQ